MAEHHELSDLTKEFTLTLRPGMGWILYVDHGPTGACGQSMSTTCPHSFLAIFKNEDEMRLAVKNGIYRNGAKKHLVYGVIGEYAAPGRFWITDQSTN